MFTLSVSLTSASLDAVKGDLRRVLPWVKSAHRCEAVARGLGFHTYAALLSATRLTDLVVTTAQGARFCAYLLEHGFDVPPIPFYRAIARVAIQAVLDQTRMLTPDGIGFGRPQRKGDGKWESPEEHYARMMEMRTELLNDESVEEFLLSLALIGRFVPTRTIRPGTGSYRLKHIAENYACNYPEGDELGPRYVANGSLIAAAIHAGFKYKTYIDDLGYDTLNASFNMSKTAVDDLDCEIRPDHACARDRRRRAERRNNQFLYA